MVDNFVHFSLFTVGLKFYRVMYKVENIETNFSVLPLGKI
jgi:hypothetical protein